MFDRMSIDLDEMIESLGLIKMMVRMMRTTNTKKKKEQQEYIGFGVNEYELWFYFCACQRLTT